ncbi:MAG: methyltransferase [Bacteroidales bacterium]|nr:methyltransferase [Bacteroidales bacterium]
MAGFRFKKFTINQDNCAMKVGTDGVLLGAWVNTNQTNQILDIGTGTGLISLMIAQRSNAKIDAIDIDYDAYNCACQNVEQSEWKERIKVFNKSLQDFSTDYKYDLIVSNPPFFENSLKASCNKRTLARHTDSLPFNDFVNICINLLSENGRLAVILPVLQGESLIEKCQKQGLFLTRRTNIKPTPEKESKRILLEFGFIKADIENSTLVIESNGRHQYSEQYKSLTKDYYLAF